MNQEFLDSLKPTPDELREMHTIKAGDEVGMYYGFPAVQLMIIRERTQNDVVEQPTSLDTEP